LLICALDSGTVIARHPLAGGKGEVFKNTHHYRDRSQQVAALEEAILKALGEPLGVRLCALLKATSPNIYKDQLRGARDVLKAHQPLAAGLIETLCERPRLTTIGRRDYLAADTTHPERLAAQTVEAHTPHPASPPGTSPLGRYAGIAADNRAEVAHDLH